MTIPVDFDSHVYAVQCLEQPLKKLYKEMYSKTELKNQNGILKNAQITHRKTEKRQRNKKHRKQTKMADIKS